MKKAALAALLAFTLIFCAAGCTAEEMLNPDQNGTRSDMTTGTAVEGNVSTTHNGVVNGDNRNLVDYGMRLVADSVARGQ
ncbi:MAG: hypothetical protein IKC04_08350 [Oscillospiraceae bacterium]|nr:hypothetical protein [Oscillospiraceae bacterium]MBR2897870.1 hypothetical protein [Oscillospiraceae bacterium]